MRKDTATKHHASSASSPLSSIPSPFFFSSARRDSPPVLNKPAMGQAESTARQPEPEPGARGPPPPSPQPTSRLRFGWPGRRKKSEDLTKLMTPPVQSPHPSPVPSATPLPPPSSINNTSIGRELARRDSDISSVEGHAGLQMHELSRPPSRTSSAKQLTLQFASNTLSVLKGKLNASQASLHSHKHSGPISPTSSPPPLPPKPDLPRLSNSSSRSSSHSEKNNSSRDQIPLEASSKAAVSPMPTSDAPGSGTEVETQNETVPTATTTSASPSSTELAGSHAHDVNVPQRRVRERREGADAQTAKEIADDWRKSDSTLRTVRLVGSRTPRPLSLAESTNSGHTVLPTVTAGAGKRLSALMTDADFGLKEVDSEEDDSDAGEPSSSFGSSPPSAFSSAHDLRQEVPSTSTKPQPTSSRRGSLSIRVGRFSGSKTRVTEHGQLSGSDSEALSSSVSTRATGTTDVGMFTANSSTTSVSSSLAGSNTKDSRPSVEIASSASISSSMSSEHRPHQYAQYKANAKLEPWIALPTTNQTASESQASLSTSESASMSSQRGSSERHADTERSGKHAAPMSPPREPMLRPAHQRTRLQSIQARGFRQTAVSLTTGFAPAAGFARKAVDKLGRALGGSSGSLAHSDETSMALGHDHTPSASTSNSSLFGMAGQYPHQHERHRHAQYPPSSSKKALRRHGATPSGTWSLNSSDTDGGAAGPHLGRCLRGPLMPPSTAKGLVFGRDLTLCVNDTACTSAIEANTDGLSLEGRSLPALVVRCAQHIVKWGVQEEGLFRISGRSTHISKLRMEFDFGADYDLRECGPGEIDPHAVSSVFKAYLRELPEPLLTHQLTPYFEAALIAENNRVKAAEAQGSNGTQQNGTGRARVPGLPSNPRDSAQIRKAPSLSTFQMPTLSPHSASQALLNAFAALIARLPKENRDVLRTVTEIIMATARASRETKMPLSNLMLVFCPTLCMSPPMLRVLCEEQGIWDGPLEVEDMKIPPVLGDVSTNETIAENAGEEAEKTDDVNSDGGRESEDSAMGLHHQATIRRPSAKSPSEPASGKPTNKEDAIEADACAAPHALLPSLVLTSDNGKASPSTGHSKADPSVNLSSPDGLVHSSSSSDSLHTPPSSSSGNISPSGSLAPSAPVSKAPFDATEFGAKVMALHAQSDLSSPISPTAVKKAVRKSLIGSPIPFPFGMGMRKASSGYSAPVTPVELSSGLEELSVSSHSTSSLNLAKDSSTSRTGSTPSRLGRRKSKTSMLGLKSKRSLSSLLGRTQEQVQMQPLRSAVPDLATVQEPASSPCAFTCCPVLDLSVDTSRIRLVEGFGISLVDELGPMAESERPVNASNVLKVPSPSPSRSPSPSPLPSSSLHPQGTSMMIERTESDSSAITHSVFYTPPTTSRALAPTVNTSVSTSSASSGSYSFLDFGLGKNGEEDDWAKSVLQAAASERD